MSTDQTPDPLIGLVVHNYIVRKRLAAGGMGAVYLATHQDPRSASKKVIKILLPEFSQHPVIRQRFEQEALAVMGLKHPYIVQIDNFGALPDGQLYLMMEFLDGETLEDHIQRRGRSTQHHTLHVLAQVMSALQSLHEAGLVHRDLKPANVFILATEQNPYFVKLIDLGIARNVAEPETQKKTVTGLAMGTPGYMAVEQYEDAASATAAADVYAAAVIAWRMLFGHAPWGEIYDERVLYYKQKMEEFELPADHGVPADLVALLRRALARDPAERPTVGDFVSRFASLTGGMPPFVLSGAEILDRVAKKFLMTLSVLDQTVRNVSHGAAMGPVLWPHRATHVSRPPSTPVPMSPPAPSPVLAPTANERPAVYAVSAPGPTTITAASGVIAVPTTTNAPGAPKRTRRSAVLLGVGGLGVVLAASLVTFTIVNTRKGTPEHDRAIEPAAASAPDVPAPGPAETATPRSSASSTAAESGSSSATTPPGMSGLPAGTKPSVPGEAPATSTSSASSSTVRPSTATTAPVRVHKPSERESRPATSTAAPPRTTTPRATMKATKTPTNQPMPPPASTVPIEPMATKAATPKHQSAPPDAGVPSTPRKDAPFDPKAVEE